MNKNLLFIILCVAALSSCIEQKKESRQVISLNGEWQIAKTVGELPETYSSVAPVPGFVDLATPVLDPDTTHYHDGWYWYRRTFNAPDSLADIASLKIFKARYHTKVYINGSYIGENYFCFSPVYFDVKPFVKAGSKNEIIIGVGCREQLPDTIQNGHDYESEWFLPGIYDEVELTFANRPYINNIQCAPDIANNTVRIVAEIDAATSENSTVSYIIKEKKSKKTVANGTANLSAEKTDCGMYIIDFQEKIKDAKLWSPDEPFLYELTLTTVSDEKCTNFGMRSFRVDTTRQMFLVNEKPYYLLGTNVVFQRFSQDKDRGTLPWNEEWVSKLINQYKSMNWRILRYHIGPVPERWYDICDSLGMMVQDEFAISGKQLQPLRAKLLAKEFTRWMRNRWNHPSIVIWDANNESTTLETGKAINTVRHLDLSNRPWENGWAKPAAPTDPYESHPYKYLWFFVDGQPSEKGYLKDLYYVSPERLPKLKYSDLNDANGNTPDSIPDGMHIFSNIRFINEFGWLWLNRDGSTTTLTKKVYKTLWGENLTGEQRLELYARHLAMLVEYYRAHRQTAGVMHFSGLGYSLPESPYGATCDNFADIKTLEFEPNFLKYLKPAYADVGLMLDLWEKSYIPSSVVQAPVYVTNDLNMPFAQEVTVTVEKTDGEVISTVKQNIEVEAFGSKVATFDIQIPAETGKYCLRAAIELKGERVFSLRDIPVMVE
ncbi:MAG: hypothetical protein LBJ17_04055 [Dysgonamonadaceae bacterium]|jgi:hypothetical protein|nr:hypothetical protein [Dysgonamonadaceae bacterium]